MIGRFRGAMVLLAIATLLLFTCGFKNCANATPQESANARGVVTNAQLDTLAKSSRELAHDVDLGIGVTSALFKGNKLSLADKDFLADKFQRLARAGSDFNKFLQRLSDQDRRGKLPSNWLSLATSEWQTVFTLYSDISTKVSALPPEAQTALTGGTHSLTADVQTIQKAVGGQP